ncbi:hypothetical protein [Schaalia hyovaginalis]|uniref:[protein-PII] uridylyltransferase family protein n=1 Tax=Schaalia hyovaginalis TaxID=29316 RepID=UPI002A755F3B|nr:hypothetical protein [Schaalia hyovaginalis]MDY2668233.1 hypothetical protein [Schaalia hyovaginalis]
MWGWSTSYGGGDIAGLFANPFAQFGLGGSFDGTAIDDYGVPMWVSVGFQMTFAIITVALISGSLAERVKFSTWMAFTAIWVTLSYFPMAHMVWGGGLLSADGPIAKLVGAAPIDFAGGTVVHINAGITGLVLALIIGKRPGFGVEAMRPHNLPFVMVGAALLLFGWFGFNAGSAFTADALDTVGALILGLIVGVRDALHLVTRRHTAKLLRADQREVARVLGFEGEEAEADLRRLLTGAGTEIDAAVRRVVDAAERQAPSWGAGALARRVIRAVAPGRGRRSGAYEATMVSESTSLVDSRLAFPAPALASDTAAVLDMARCCADTGIEPAGSALDAISAAVWKGEHAIRGRWMPEVTRSFEALLAAPRGFVRAWTHLETTGVIDAWIPEFAEVRSRPQSAAFHRWTVDRHLAETVARANDARTGVEAWAWPFPEVIVPWDSVLLAAFLHDLGKRPGAHGPDYPVLGAALVPTVLERLGLGGRCADVSLLVDRHLVLAELATKEDPAAPRTADRLLEAVGGSERALAALAVLTRADSQGAGPKAWTA